MSHRTPTLFHPPTWDTSNLRPVANRTYGTPGAHLEQVAARARTRHVTLWVVSVALLTVALVGAVIGINAIYLSDMPVNPARFAQAAILAGLFGLYRLLQPLERSRALRAERGRNQAGLEGERRVAEALESLPASYRIVHGVDITYPDSYPEDIDHVVVSPESLTLIDTKNWSGDVVITENSVLHNGRDVTEQVVDGSLRRAGQLTAYLGWEPPVRVVVCFAGRARAEGKIRGVHFTDRAGLIELLKHRYELIHPDMVKETAEDTALLSPTATTTRPWRHTYTYLPPQQRRAHQLRGLYWPALVMTFPLGGSALALGSITLFNAFHDIMGTGRELVEPLRAGAGFVLTGAATLGLLAAERALRRTPRRVTPVLRAPRAEGRTQRLRATALGKPTKGFTQPQRHDAPAHDQRPHDGTRPDRAHLERAFTQELILPPDTLEELVTVQMLLTNSEEFKREWGQELPYGVLLHGPPGTGKTQIARTMAKVAGFAFYSAKPSELRNMYVGESAKAIQSLYDEARENAPALVFIDEIDAVAGKRGAVTDGAAHEANHAVNQLLQEIDGLAKSDKPIFTVGATNLLENLDDAIRSRLAYQILIGLPDQSAREKMWRKFAAPFLDRLDVSIEELAAASEGMSGRDIKQVVTLAAKFAFAGEKRVTRRILERAFERTGHTLGQPTH